LGAWPKAAFLESTDRTPSTSRIRCSAFSVTAVSFIPLLDASLPPRYIPPNL
jgi:hypothetical protein